MRTAMPALLPLLLLSSRHALAKVQTNSLFSDGMVLQTSADATLTQPTTLYGTASPHEPVTLTASSGFPGVPYAATADASGAWSIQLKPDVASAATEALAGQFTLTLSGATGGAKVVATNVVFGDVYLCTGQSNMEKTVSYTWNGTAEIALAKHPQMRLFQRQSVACQHGVPPPGVSPSKCGPNGPWKTPSRELDGSCIYPGSPGKNCPKPNRTWTAVTPEVIGQFSAICYYSVRDVARMQTGSRPQGLIESDWGGTPVQAWTKPDGLKACGLSTTNCTTEKGGNCSHYPSTLYNHMVMPFVGYGLRSVLWYQGEANSDEGFPMLREQYACAFAQMILGWRESWGAPSMPFGFVQLSSWTGNWGFDNLPCTENWCPVISRIRMAQADVVAQAGPPVAPLAGTPPFPLQNTFMAIAIDQGDNQGHGVHPRFKTSPAHRLALQIMHTAFGGQFKGKYSGPLPLSAAKSAAGVSVKLSHASGLRLNDTHTCNEQFKRLCCKAGATAFGARICTATKAKDCVLPADGKTIFDANVTVGADGASITISAAGAPRGAATFVDFGQTDFPQCSVVNDIDVALGPFLVPVKTDDAPSSAPKKIMPVEDDWLTFGGHVAWHSSNTSGSFSDAQVLELAKYKMVSFEKYSNLAKIVPAPTLAQPFSAADGLYACQSGANLSRCGCCAEDQIVAAARRVKAANPRVVTVAYRNAEISYPWYRSAKEVAQHPSWWVVGAKAGPKNATWNVFDLTVPAAAAHWEQAALSFVASGVIDTVFADGCDTNARSSDPEHPLSPAKVAALHAAKGSMLRSLQQKLPGPIVCGSDGVFRDGVDAVQAEGWGFARAGKTTFATHEIPLLMKAAAAGVVFQAHGRAACNQSHEEPACCKALGGPPCDCSMQIPPVDAAAVQSEIAAFLIGMGPRSFYLCGSWLDTFANGSSSWLPLYDLPLGKPLANAVLGADKVWRRSFGSGTRVRFDTRTERGNISWAAKTDDDSSGDRGWENITSYHVNQGNYSVPPLNMNTATLRGDMYFALRSQALPVECTPNASLNCNVSEWSCFDCKNSEVLSKVPLVVTKLVLSVDPKQYGSYSACNVFAGVYRCNCWKDCSPGVVPWSKSCNGTSKCTNLTVGKLNVSSMVSIMPNITQACAINKTSLACVNSYWHVNIAAKTGGQWFSTLSTGYKKSWKVAEAVKKISKACSDVVIHGAVQKLGAPCFSTLPKAEQNNQSTLGWIQCFYQTLLGKKGVTSFLNTSEAPNSGIPLATLEEIWARPFASDDPAKGGCPNLFKTTDDHMALASMPLNF